MYGFQTGLPWHRLCGCGPFCCFRQQPLSADHRTCWFRRVFRKSERCSLFFRFGKQPKTLQRRELELFRCRIDSQPTHESSYDSTRTQRTNGADPPCASKYRGAENIAWIIHWLDNHYTPKDQSSYDACRISGVEILNAIFISLVIRKYNGFLTLIFFFANTIFCH